MNRCQTSSLIVGYERFQRRVLRLATLHELFQYVLRLPKPLAAATIIITITTTMIFNLHCTALVEAQQVKMAQPSRQCSVSLCLPILLALQSAGSAPYSRRLASIVHVFSIADATAGKKGHDHELVALTYMLGMPQNHCLSGNNMASRNLKIGP